MLDAATDRDRVATLIAYDLLDIVPDERLDAIVRDAAAMAGTPISLISLIDDRRQFFGAKLGIDQDELPIDQSICALAIQGDDLLVIEDARENERVRCLVGAGAAAGIRFYAGVPLKLDNGIRVGTLSVLDARPRDDFDLEKQRRLASLARRAVAALELRRKRRLLEATARSGDQWLGGSLELLERATVMLEQVNATGPIAHLAQVIDLIEASLLKTI